jgi:hypothetical protein
MKIRNPYRMKLLVLAMTLFTLTFATGYVWYSHGDKIIQEQQDVMFMVSHTEYRYGEQGQIVVRLVDASDNAIAVDNCTATILYPDKTIYLGPALMNSTLAITGDHYYQFTTPNGPEGVYEYQAVCTWNSGARTKSATNSFHLSSAFTTIQTQISDLNNTVLSINSSLSSQLSAVNLSISSSISDFRQEVQANFSDVLAAIAGLTQANYSGILNEINTTLAADYALDLYMNATQQAMVASLAEINTTTQNTYTYLTTTLAGNVNSVLVQLGVMNATLNRVEGNTLSINSTVNQILANQQNDVIMNVYSG